MSTYHFGDKVTQHGNNNIGIVKNQETADTQTSLEEMIKAVHLLRSQVAPADQQVIDESLAVINADGSVEKSTFRHALTSIAGIATIVGDIGTPVIEAIRKVMQALGV